MIPQLDELKMSKMSKQYDQFFKVFRIYEPTSQQMLVKWSNREKIKESCSAGGILEDIYMRAQKELDRQTYGPPVKQIITKYFRLIGRLRKNAAMHSSYSDGLSKSTMTSLHKIRKELQHLEEHFFEECMIEESKEWTKKYI